MPYPPLHIAIPSFVLSERTQKVLQSCSSQLTINTGPRPNQEQLRILLEKHEHLIIGIKERINPSIFQGLNLKTKLLGTLSIGTDHLDLEACKAAGITVVNAPTANVTSVAEHTLSLLLALRKQFKDSNNAVRSGQGRKGLDKWPRDLRGMTVGLVGAGRIAYETAKYLHFFGVQLKGWTFRPDQHPEFEPFGLQWVNNLEELFTSCDAVSLHLPFTPATENLITLELLSSIQHRPFHFINTSRAELVAKDALPKAMKQGLVDAVGLDVLREDESWEDYPEERSYLSPHVAGVTDESLERLSFELATRMADSILKTSQLR